MLAKCFQLGPSGSIHQVRALRHQQNDKFKITETPGERGHQVSIHHYLKLLLERNPELDSSKPLLLKISIDGGTVTSGKRIQQELLTVSMLCPDLRLQQLKSTDHTHLTLTYIGELNNKQLL
jgi:hypothetical protein